MITKVYVTDNTENQNLYKITEMPRTFDVTANRDRDEILVKICKLH